MIFQKSGGVLCFLPKVEKGKEEQREGGRRKGENVPEVFRRCTTIGMFMPNVFRGFPEHAQKIPFDVHRKGSPQERCA